MKKIIVALFALTSMVAFANEHKAADHGTDAAHAEAPKAETTKKAKKAAKKAHKADEAHHGDAHHGDAHKADEAAKH